MSKVKQLSIQEWAILLLFIFSIILLITVVELSAVSPAEVEGSDALIVSEKNPDMFTYNSITD
ncbi:hypothetical protein [Alteribacillus sp. HJP-4]|uniref:hypothetical protein n=1 Tax=Alteribacillus sp. HJP-4 TaxID=2775394 RepID=UPI0035CD3AF0